MNCVTLCVAVIKQGVTVRDGGAISTVGTDSTPSAYSPTFSTIIASLCAGLLAFNAQLNQ